MTAESDSPVTGPNGEIEGIDVEARVVLPAPVEAIQGQRFSLWKTDRPLQANPPRFSRGFGLLILALGLGLLAGGAWVAGRIRQGEFWIGNAFAIGLFIAMYGVPIAVILVMRLRRRRSAEPGDPPPVGIPPSAVPAKAGSYKRGRSFGWLWFEGDLMRFRGVGFDFDLRREDFQTKGKVGKIFRNGAAISLRAPKGLSEYRLTLTLGVRRGERFEEGGGVWESVAEAFAAWESGSYSSLPALFPPVRPVPSLRPKMGLKDWVLPPLFMGALIGAIPLLLPLPPAPDGSVRTPLSLGLAGAAFGLMWPGLIWSAYRLTGVYDREADRAKRR